MNILSSLQTCVNIIEWEAQHMPKKTKQQKKQSDMRRHVEVTKPHPVTTNTITNVAEKKYTLSEYDITLKSHTIRDLKKTLLISALLFALVFFVFYANLSSV